MMKGSVLDLLPQYKYFFSKPQFMHFFAFITGLIVAEKGRKNVKTISQIAEIKNQSSLNRYLTVSKWNPVKILCEFIMSVIPKRHGGILILDDTKVEKSAEHTEGVSNLKDYVEGKFGFYHVMVSTLYVGFGRIIPMFLDIYMREEVALKMNHPFKSKIEIGIDLLQNCLKFITPKAIVFDSWYLEKLLTDSLPKGVKWVSRLKINWLVTYHGNELPAKLLFCLVPKERFRHTKVKFGKSRYRWVASVWVNVKVLGRVKLVLLKKRRNSVSGIILCSNANWSMMEIIALYKKRWAIEVFYRDTKQNLGLGDYCITKLDAVFRHMHLVSLTYGLMKNAKLLFGKNKMQYNGTIGDMCRAIRTDYLLDRIVSESIKQYEELHDKEKVVEKMRELMPIM